MGLLILTLCFGNFPESFRECSGIVPGLFRECFCSFLGSGTGLFHGRSLALFQERSTRAVRGTFLGELFLEQPYVLCYFTWPFLARIARKWAIGSLFRMIRSHRSEFLWTKSHFRYFSSKKGALRAEGATNRSVRGFWTDFRTTSPLTEFALIPTDDLGVASVK